MLRYGGGTPPLNQAELRDGPRRCCTGRPNGEAAFGEHSTCWRTALLYSIGCCSEMWALPPQPYSRHEKQRWRLRTPRSTIVRLPSGSSASRSATFRSGPSSFGGGTAHPCTGAYGGSSAHPHSASDFSFGVSLCIHPHKRTAKLGRNTSLRFAAHLCGGCPIPPHSKSTAPWILRLARPR